MERDYGYQYNATAHKESNDSIEVPYFVTPEFQRAKREQELRRQQIEKEQYEKKIAELELQKRTQHQKTGRHVNNIIKQHNQEYSRAREKRSQNKLRKFVTEMAVIMLISSAVFSGIIGSIDTKEEEKDNDIKIESEAPHTNSLEDYLEQYDNIDIPETIHHYETEDLERENLSADDFCENLDKFLVKDEPLIGNDLEEKTWNLLYDQIGCSSEQSAAILGNMLVEDPSLNPFQHQIFSSMPNRSNTEIVNNELGLGPFQFSGVRKKSFLEFIQNSEKYHDLYDKFTTPKKYSAMTYAELSEANLANYNLSDEDCDRGLKCVFDYISYEMQYPDDANYNRNQWNKAFVYNETDDDKLSISDLAIGFAKNFERTPNDHDRRIAEAERVHHKYFDSITN